MRSAGDYVSGAPIAAGPVKAVDKVLHLPGGQGRRRHSNAFPHCSTKPPSTLLLSSRSGRIEILKFIEERYQTR
jgi:hypothetical protein